MKEYELINIKGGALNASLLNALSRGTEVIYKIGRSFGSTIKMLFSGKRC